jgi:transporter family protein
MTLQIWFYWALLSAVFAALTAIFAKVGLEGVNSDFATLIRSFIILIVLAWFVYYTGKWSDPLSLHPKTWSFLALSGLATGASWVCYFLQERPPLKDWLGILLVAGGVFLLALK